MNKDELRSIMPVERIEGFIYVIRGQKIILDRDLAMLYGVETKQLNRAVMRNRKRFPEDFIFQMTKQEWINLKCQFGTSSSDWGGKRKLPIAFTGHGVAMASNLLKSARAVEMSVEIVRAFIRIRQVLAGYKEMNKELTDLKSFLLKHSNSNDREFRRVWQTIEKLSSPPAERKIGFDLD
jgi:hypothetical protein